MTKGERSAGAAQWARLLLFVYLFLMTVVYPLYMRDGYRQLGEAKYYVYRNISLAVLALLAVVGVAALAGRHGKKGTAAHGTQQPGRAGAAAFWRALSLTDRFMLFYAASCLLSAAFAIDYRTAVFGLTGWRMGLLTNAFLIAFYFLYSRISVYGQGGSVRTAGAALSLFTAGGTVVCAIALLNRFSIVRFGGEYETSFLSTIGNINWYCGYLSVFLPVMELESMFDADRRRRALACAASFVGFASAATQGGASGFIVLGALFLFAFAVGAERGLWLLRALRLVCLFGAACQVVRLLRVLGGGSGYFNDYYYYNETAAGDSLTSGNGTLWLLLGGLAAYTAVRLYLRKRQTDGATRAHCAVESGYKTKQSGVESGGKTKQCDADAALVLWTRRARLVVLTALAVCAALYLGLLAFHTARPGVLPALDGRGAFTFDGDWGSARGATWTAAAQTYAALPPGRKLVGVGEDCFSAAAYGVSHVEEALRARFGGAMLRNAHNEWLTVLVNNGLFGLPAYAGIFIAAFVSFVRAGRREPLLYIAAGAVLAYTLHNMVSFRQVTSTPFIFLLLGMGEGMRRELERNGYR